eukprot:7379984-Prymnesium_polylepis.1
MHPLRWPRQVAAARCESGAHRPAAPDAPHEGPFGHRCRRAQPVGFTVDQPRFLAATNTGGTRSSWQVADENGGE